MLQLFSHFSLRAQCEHLDIPVPPIFRKWLCLKIALFKHWGNWPRGLLNCMEVAGLSFTGQKHSGIGELRRLSVEVFNENRLLHD